MDINDLVQALNGILKLGDTLDNTGVGIQTISNGQHTTRGIIQLELGQFLLYVGDGGTTFTEGQAALVNLLLSERCAALDVQAGFFQLFDILADFFVA